MIESTVVPNNSRLVSVGLIDTARRAHVYDDFVDFARLKQITGRHQISRFPLGVEAVIEEDPIPIVIENAGITCKSFVP